MRSPQQSSTWRGPTRISAVVTLLLAARAASAASTRDADNDLGFDSRALHADAVTSVTVVVIAEQL